MAVDKEKLKDNDGDYAFHDAYTEELVRQIDENEAYTEELDTKLSLVNITSLLTAATGVTELSCYKVGNLVQLKFVFKPVVGWNNAVVSLPSGYRPKMQTVLAVAKTSGTEGSLNIGASIDTSGNANIHLAALSAQPIVFSGTFII